MVNLFKIEVSKERQDCISVSPRRTKLTSGRLKKSWNSIFIRIPLCNFKRCKSALGNLIIFFSPLVFVFTLSWIALAVFDLNPQTTKPKLRERNTLKNVISTLAGQPSQLESWVRVRSCPDVRKTAVLIGLVVQHNAWLNSVVVNLQQKLSASNKAKLISFFNTLIQ